MHVGIVAEGNTDHVVLRAFLTDILGPDTIFEAIQPSASRSFDHGGWTEVRRWCVDNGPDLADIMRAVEGAELQYLVVHLDADVGRELNIAKPCPPPTDACTELRARVADWLGSLPNYVVVATPAQKTEAWLVAALVPAERARADVECDANVDAVLVREGFLRARRGKTVKSTKVYKRLVARLTPEAVAASVAVCTEAVVFRERMSAAPPFLAP